VSSSSAATQDDAQPWVACAVVRAPLTRPGGSQLCAQRRVIVSRLGLVTSFRHAAGPGRPTLASWSTAVVELAGLKSTAEARELIRELRVLLAGDPAPERRERARQKCLICR